MALHIGRGAHVPEHGKDKRDDGQEAQSQNPEDVQDVRNAIADGTRDPSTDTRPPSTIDLVAGRTSGQESHKQDHAAQGTHRGTNDDKDHLQCFDPQESQIEHPVQHYDEQATAPVHRPAEDDHSDETHYRCDECRVRNPRYT